MADLAAPRHVWIMVPAAFVGATVDRLAPLLAAGDTIIDGGNSWYHDDVDRSRSARRDYGIHYLDVGTSGGVLGLERGYCLMVGGDADAVARMAPIFDTLAPGVEAAERTPGRSRRSRLRRARVVALRPVGCRALREDGPQRDRVRTDGRLRRGTQRARQGGRRVGDAHRRRRDGAARPSRVLPVRPRSRRDHPSSGGGAASSPAGCSTSPPRRCTTTRSSRSTPATSATPARGAGRSTPRSTKACRCRCCRPPCTSASPRGDGPTSPTRCSRRCAPGSAATPNAGVSR